MKELIAEGVYVDREKKKFIVDGKEWPVTGRNYEAIKNRQLDKLSDIVLDFGE